MYVNVVTWKAPGKSKQPMPAASQGQPAAGTPKSNVTVFFDVFVLKFVFPLELNVRIQQHV